VLSAEQSAIIGAIQSEKNNRHNVVMTRHELLERCWIIKDQELPSYGFQPQRNISNEKTNQAAKEALDEDISTNERYPSDDLKKWLTEEDFKKRDQRWKNGDKEMKEKKPDVDRNKEIKRMPKERASSNILFCNSHLSVDHILWECKEN
jgi:hypothetical protein